MFICIFKIYRYIKTFFRKHIKILCKFVSIVSNNNPFFYQKETIIHFYSNTEICAESKKWAVGNRKVGSALEDKEATKMVFSNKFIIF